MSVYKLAIIFIGILGIYVNVVFGPPVKDIPANPKRWNIITIVTDDQGVWTVGA